MTSMTIPTPYEICERLEGLSVWPRNVADAFAEHIPARHTTMLYAVSDAMHDAKATIERLSAALERIAQPVFVAAPEGTPDGGWFVALNERIGIARTALGRDAK